MITSDDKDFEPCFTQMHGFALWDLFTIAHDVAGIESPYSDEELDKLKTVGNKEAAEAWLDEVFDVKTNLDNHEWLEAVVKKVKEVGYILNSETIRNFAYKETKVKRHAK